METSNSLALFGESAAPSTVFPFAHSAPGQTTHQIVVAQAFDQDLFSRSGGIFSNFVESGQIWALLIGLFLGYMVRGLTSY